MKSFGLNFAVVGALALVGQAQGSANCNGTVYSTGQSPAYGAWSTSNSDNYTSAIEAGGGVREIRSNAQSFAAILESGDILAWGESDYGGDASGVADQVTAGGGAKQLFGNRESYVALLEDDSIVGWGYSWAGGDTSGINTTNITSVHAMSIWAYLVMNEAGEAQILGSINHIDDGWSSGDKRLSLDEVNAAGAVRDVVASNDVIAILTEAGKVVTAGDGTYANMTGVDPNADLSVGVEALYANTYAFAALKSDGGLECWGYGPYGGDCSHIDFAAGGGVRSVHPAPRAFLAVLNDDSIVFFPGNMSDVTFTGANITKVVVPAESTHFTVLQADGNVTAFSVSSSGDTTGQQYFTNVKDVVANDKVVAAVNFDGSMIAFPSTSNSDYGQDLDRKDVDEGIIDVIPVAEGFFAVKASGGTVRTGSAYHSGLLDEDVRCGMELLAYNDKVTVVVMSAAPITGAPTASPSMAPSAAPSSAAPSAAPSTAPSAAPISLNANQNPTASDDGEVDLNAAATGLQIPLLLLLAMLATLLRP